MRKTVAEFESNLVCPKILIFPIGNSQDSVTNGFTKLMFKLYVTMKDTLWMWNVCGLEVYMMPKSWQLRRNVLPSTFQYPVEGGEKIPNYLIGDPAYPLVPFCMKEYESCSNINK